MKKNNKGKLGFALCGSFCTIAKAVDTMQKLAEEGWDILPIMSFNVYNLDTKFGKSEGFRKRVEEICNKPIINSLVTAEPVGPKKMVDIMLIAPCTGNTLAKLCHAITDTPVTMAAKSHLRIQRPVVISLATNDALGATAQNLGKMLNRKNIYFVPMEQDDIYNKPLSLVANFDLIPQTLEEALQGKQIRPVWV